MSANSSDDSSIVEKNITRRRAMQITAGAAVTVATIGAGAGTAAAETVNFESDLVQNPRLEGSVSVAEHDLEEMVPLEYIADDGSIRSLEDMGGAIPTRVDEETVHNPISLRADRFDAAEYRKFPRGEQYDEDSDGDAETDLDVLDATHWTADESNGGSMTVEDADSPADASALHVASSGQSADGDEVVASFSDFSIESGEDRKMLQIVLSAETLEAGAVVTIAPVDEDGDRKEAVIDPSADAADDGVIATETVTGAVYQQRLGELPTVADGDGDFNNIQKVEVSIANANADVTISALNLERESMWGFGTREFLNDDDEVETETVREPAGEFSITDLGSIESPLSTATLADVGYEIELQASGLPDEAVDYEVVDAEPYDRPHRFRAVFSFDVETAYDLSWSLSSLNDDVLYPGGRYVEAGISTGEDDAVTVGDVDDEDVSLTDRTGTYEDASIDDEIELSSAVSAGSVTAVFVDYTVSSDERDAIEDVSGGGAVATGGGGGGGFFGGIRGWIMMVAASVGGWIAWTRRRVGA